MSVFIRVVEKGSFSAVAEEMQLSGTMIGMHIKGLEKILGTRLLNRTTRRQSLTDFGEIYYRRCKQILADIEDIEHEAQTLQQHPRGKLKIVCPVTFGAHALSPATALFLQQWPDVTVDLVLSDKPVDMAEEGVDITIKIGELENVNALIARELAPYKSIVCAAPSYLENAGTPCEPEDLIHHRCIGFSHPLASREWTLTKEGSPIRSPVNIVMASNNGEALRHAAIAGLGIIMQPEILLADDLRQGKLIPVLSAYPPLTRPVHILTFSDRQQLPKIRLYVDFLLHYFKKTLCFIP